MNEALLALGKLDCCTFQKVTQSGARNLGTGERVFSAGMTPGTADLLGCVCGAYVGAEAKTGNAKRSRAQEDWAARIERVGGYALLFRSVPELLRLVESIAVRMQRHGFAYDRRRESNG